MLIKCSKIEDLTSIELPINGMELMLYSRNGQEICTGYARIVKKRRYSLFEIPIKNMVMASIRKEGRSFNKKFMELKSRDGSISKARLWLVDDEKSDSKKDMVYVSTTLLYKLFKQ